MTITAIASELQWVLDASGAGRVGLWHLDIVTGWIDCTTRCKENLGFPATHKLHVDDLYKIMHPDDREATGAIVQHAIETRGEYHMNYRVFWPDGAIHWIDSRGRVGDGVITGTTIDITEQRAIEDRLARESGLIRMVTTHVAEALWFMNERGEVTFMNPAAEQLVGWTMDEVRGQLLHQLVHYKRPDGRPFPMEDCPLGQTLFGGVPLRGAEDLWLHRSGRFIPVLCSSTPIVDDGVIQGAVISAVDISERKAAEEALLATSRAKDEFLATVSHELRTPMTAILGWVGYLRMCGIPEELKTAVEEIENSAKAQAAIVDDLVDVSRIVTGKLRLHFKEFDLVEVLDDAIRTIRPTAEAKQITLTTTTNCEDARVRADPSRLRQVLWNLLTNAIKFTPERGEVSVEATVMGGEVIVSVSDTGIGIAPDFLPHVFDRFAQGSSSGYQPGLGLGLAIVKQLLDMHGGRITAASDGPGCGATFTVALPRI